MQRQAPHGMGANTQEQAMRLKLDVVDLGRAKVETKQSTIAPIFYDGVGYQYFYPWW
jgi:hypothetical protein